MKREIDCLSTTVLAFLGILLGIVILGITAESDEIRRVIKIEADGVMLHYQKESFWNEKSFFKILNSKEEFEIKEINSFKKELGEYGRAIVNPEVKFDASKRATFLLCDIKGAKEDYWFDFDWFLRPLDLDFLDNHFKRRGKELYWQGNVKGVDLTISIEFPFLISNCHEHVWAR